MYHAVRTVRRRTSETGDDPSRPRPPRRRRVETPYPREPAGPPPASRDGSEHARGVAGNSGSSTTPSRVIRKISSSTSHLTAGEPSRSSRSFVVGSGESLRVNAPGGVAVAHAILDEETATEAAMTDRVAHRDLSPARIHIMASTVDDGLQPPPQTRTDEKLAAPQLPAREKVRRLRNGAQSSQLRIRARHHSVVVSSFHRHAHCPS